jgi:hypothetical protein
MKVSISGGSDTGRGIIRDISRILHDAASATKATILIKESEIPTRKDVPLVRFIAALSYAGEERVRLEMEIEPSTAYELIEVQLSNGKVINQEGAKGTDLQTLLRKLCFLCQ